MAAVGVQTANSVLLRSTAGRITFSLEIGSSPAWPIKEKNYGNKDQAWAASYYFCFGNVAYESMGMDHFRFFLWSRKIFGIRKKRHILGGLRRNGLAPSEERYGDVEKPHHDGKSDWPLFRWA